ncbi:MAG: ABC transporter ATP-binding protein [Anaerolineales bacterium]|nr:ABC transporter ATP-binding protein [Anaerolineales bacterium]
MEQGLQVQNIHKQYGNTQALAGVSFQVQPGEVTALLGPSGCGKSTLLAIIAGLEAADQGQVFWESEEITAVPTHQRYFGLMFQDYMLFPHMNVANNIAFGLRMQNMQARHIQAAVDRILTQVGLPGYQQRNVSTLSGGEQQRVALGRALAPHPRLLMLDEPLGSLDRVLRERLLVELRTILHSMKQTAIYVTHDQEEAFALADQVVVMQRGRVAQIGEPQDIYQQPASAFVAEFLGFENLFQAEISHHSDTASQLRCALGNFPITTQQRGGVQVLLRPDRVQLQGEMAHSLNGQVIERSFRGSLCRVRLKSLGQVLSFDFPSSTRLPDVGENIRLFFDPDEAFQILP